MANPSPSVKVYAVVNPVAGNSDAATLQQALAERFTQLNWGYEIYETTGREQVTAMVRTAIDRGFNFFIAAGGDGTVSAVAGGLVQSGLPMAILPVGTGNALARELRVPLQPDEAMTLFQEKYVARDIDAMQVGERFLVLNVSVGLSSLTMRETHAQEKRQFGRAAYIWKGLLQLMGFQPRRFQITADGIPVLLRASEVAAVNAATLGASTLEWGPHIRIDDGQLDICIIYARTAADYARLAWKLWWRQEATDPAIRYLTARESVTIACDRPLPVQGDGESIGQAPVQIRLVPAAVRVVVPPDSGGASKSNLSEPQAMRPATAVRPASGPF